MPLRAAIEGAAAPAAEPAKAAEPQTPDPTPEQTAVMVDLHWLIHQGAVLEFADGRMETAKKPLPKPAKLEKPAKRPEEKITTNAGEATTAPEAPAAMEPATDEPAVPASAAGEATEANSSVAEMATAAATEPAPVTTLEAAAKATEIPASEPAPSAPPA